MVDSPTAALTKILNVGDCGAPAATWILASLWMRGLKVVPLTAADRRNVEKDAEARRVVRKQKRDARRYAAR